tara:strand:+ start:320 stop:775 length:456 start_codon:yes stop_codon:yes gene_type:complete
MSYRIPLEGEMLESRMIELIKKHLEISISTSIDDWDNVDCNIYSESTADGYEVYVCTNTPSKPVICEEVYYYEHDLTEAFTNAIDYGDQTFYICDTIYEDCYFDDALVELFVDHVDDIVENDELDITIEEINYLKKEYELENKEADSPEVV